MALRPLTRSATRSATRWTTRSTATRFDPFAVVAPVALLAAVTLLASPAPAVGQSACGAYHTVDTGDSLLEIAERCGVTLPALLAANPGVVDRMDLEVGDRLRIPDPRAAQPSPVEACGSSYQVRTGDTLAEIAQKCGLTVPLLVAANPPLPDPLGVDAGRTIRIPNVPRRAVDDPATVAAAARMIADETGAADVVEVGEVVEDVEVSEEADVAADTVAAEEGAADEGAGPELIEVVGTLERGERCLLVRPARGEAVAIAGGVHVGFRPGERVVLMGVPTEDDRCAHSPALELRILYSGGRAPR